VPASAFEAELTEFVADTYDDPLAFVLGAYPWGEPGPLQDHAGPDEWQRDFLLELGKEIRKRKFDGVKPVAPIRVTVSSGHGIGKSVLVAWLVNWIMSTRPNAQGTVSANTITQLQTKTWSTLQKWTKLCLTGHWFTVNTERMYYTGRKEAWFCSPQSSKRENSEAFAGQHAADSTSFYILDEASAIDDKIWEVAEGGLTDGEPMIFVFGNPTRSNGEFHKVTFGLKKNRWTQFVIDSRKSRFTNKEQLKEWAQDYGEDSDFFRVRVRGLPPRASDLQFIPSDTVFEAQRRPIAVLSDEPLVAGLDVARGGADKNVFRFRRGADARSIPAIRVPGEQTRDSMRLVTMAAELLDRTFDGRKIATLFIDGTGIGGPIADRLRQLGHKNVVEVQFGAESPDPKCANMRSYMWSRMRDWMPKGCIDTDSTLEIDLTGPSYFHNSRDQVVLESKESLKARGLDSPDDGDGLALTFAAPVKPTTATKKRAPFKPTSPWG
jgi:hypothetical protein